MKLKRPNQTTFKAGQVWRKPWDLDGEMTTDVLLLSTRQMHSNDPLFPYQVLVHADGTVSLKGTCPWCRLPDEPDKGWEFLGEVEL